MWQSTIVSPQYPQDVCLIPYGNLDIANFSKWKKWTRHQKNRFIPRDLTWVVSTKIYINGSRYTLFVLLLPFLSHMCHGIVIVPLVMSKIRCISYLNIQYNFLYPFIRRQMLIIIKVDSNKILRQDFFIHVLGAFVGGHGDLPLVDQSMQLFIFHIQDLPCHNFVLLWLECILCLIESACPILLINNLDTLLYKTFEAFRDIYVIIETVICEEQPFIS